MKGSIKNFKSFAIVMVLGLLAVNTQAQVMTASTFSENTFLAALDQPEMTATGASIISRYQEGAAIIKLDNKFGLINQQGYEICQPIYDDIHLFNHGYAAVKKNGKWTFVNKQGKRLTPARYDWVGSFENGYAAVQTNGKWGLLNEQGFEIVPTIFDAVKIDQDGKIWTKQKNTWKPFGDQNNIDEQIAGTTAL